MKMPLYPQRVSKREPTAEELEDEGAGFMALHAQLSGGV